MVRKEDIMGWSGSGIYDGDETQTQHILFMEWLGFKQDKLEDILGVNKTKLTEQMIVKLVKHHKKIAKKMQKIHPKFKFRTEDDAFTWQMLLALFIDNKLFSYTGPDNNPFTLFSLDVFENGITATEYLKEQFADDYDNPSERKRKLNAFIRKANNQFTNISKYFYIEDGKIINTNHRVVWL